MLINLKFFAGLRETLGQAADSLVLPGESGNTGDVLAMLRQRGGIWAEALGDERLFRVAVDHCMGTLATPVRHRSEVAFFPPVTGG